MSLENKKESQKEIDPKKFREALSKKNPVKEFWFRYRNLVILIIIISSIILVSLVSVTFFRYYDELTTRESVFSLQAPLPESHKASLGESTNFPEGMIHYPNMRFKERLITYDIDKGCNERFSNKINKAFGIISEKTVLNFERDYTAPQIIALCLKGNNSNEQNGYIKLGEGGPDYVSSSGRYSIIHNGTIRLYELDIESNNCDMPVVSIHEILHVLGFKHSTNPESIMYEKSNCSQKIDIEIIEKINNLYSDPALPWLSFQNVSLKKIGKYLNLNVTIFNEGLATSEEVSLTMLEGDKELYQTTIRTLEPGTGISISVSYVSARYSTNEIALIIDKENSIEEIDKSNNRIILIAE